MAITLPKGVKPASDFAVQTIIGALLFALVAGVAAALGIFLHWLTTVGFNAPWFVEASDLAERALFAFDGFTFSLFLLKEAATLARGLWRDWRSS